MSFARRALCPCGSLRPRRDCCAAAARGRRLGLAVLEGGGLPVARSLVASRWPVSRRRSALVGLRAWELDLVNIDAADGGPRTLRLVMAGATVLHVREIPRTTGELSSLAAMEGAILAAADETGAFPEEIRMRDAELARMLTARLVRWRVRCRTDQRLQAIDTLSADLRRMLQPRASVWPSTPG